MSSRMVPRLSLRQYTQGSLEDKKSFSQELFRGLKEYGFIILKDHLVEQNLIDEAYSEAAKFFSLPKETKQTYEIPDGAGQRGYTSFGKEHAKGRTAGDLKEFWHVGRDFKKEDVGIIGGENIWPSEIETFKPVMQKLFSSLDETSIAVFEALSFALDVPQHFFRDMVEGGNTVLRVIHYPPLEEGRNPEAVRSAPHTDINLMTFLVGATEDGLELLDRDGNWLPVKTEYGEIVVDAADCLSRITNEVIPSTIHRVVNPQGDKQTTSRYSMPFFVHPKPGTVLSCLDSCRDNKEPYPSIDYSEFLSQRLKDLGLY